MTSSTLINVSSTPPRRLLSALEASTEGELNVGDKSSPEDIWKLLPGLSKAQYKAGVGALLRYGHT